MGVNYGRYGRFADVRVHGQLASGKSLAVTMPHSCANLLLSNQVDHLGKSLCSISQLK
jgi:hypothetical protein